MYRFLKLSIFAALTCIALAGHAVAQETRWAVIQPGERYYSEGEPSAMIQNGDEVMLISLDPMRDTWTVSVILKGNDDRTPIANVLSFGDAPKETLALSEGDPKMSAKVINDNFSVYTFLVPENFMQSAKKARYWNVWSDLGQSTFRMLMAGSSDAIEELGYMADDIRHTIVQGHSDDEQLWRRCDQRHRSGASMSGECVDTGLPLTIWKEAKPGDIYYDEELLVAYLETETDTVALTYNEAYGGWIAVIIVSEFPSVTSFRSHIDLGNGATQTRTLNTGDFDRDVDTAEQTQTLAFKISTSDINLFESGLNWTIRAGLAERTYTLLGLGSALYSIQDRIEAGGATKPQGSQNIGQAIAECDAAAGNSEDENQPGQGVSWADINASEAVFACEKAVQLAPGDGRMLYQLGRAYDKARNPRAIDLIKAAISTQYPAAYNHMGMLYWYGDYTEQDYWQAGQYLKLGAELGNLQSSYNYAHLLVEQGDGGDEDLENALAAILFAADQGYIAAHESLGDWLRDGTFGWTDYPAAREHYEIAAFEGSLDAHYGLSQMYRSGQGTPINQAEANAYLEDAARLGHVKARQELGWD